jgi:hypothetical protein
VSVCQGGGGCSGVPAGLLIVASLHPGWRVVRGSRADVKDGAWVGGLGVASLTVLAHSRGHRQSSGVRCAAKAALVAYGVSLARKGGGSLHWWLHCWLVCA